MKTDVPLRIVLVSPPAGMDFGVQHGKGNDYTTILTQRSKRTDLVFEFTVAVKDSTNDVMPNFLGPLSQGPAAGRFVYIDVGKYAGQIDSRWDRRIKVPLGKISWELIQRTTANPKLILEARLPGTGEDGGPSCATVHPVEGWKCLLR